MHDHFVPVPISVLRFSKTHVWRIACQFSRYGTYHILPREHMSFAISPNSAVHLRVSCTINHTPSYYIVAGIKFYKRLAVLCCMCSYAILSIMDTQCATKIVSSSGHFQNQICWQRVHQWSRRFFLVEDYVGWAEEVGWLRLGKKFFFGIFTFDFSQSFFSGYSQHDFFTYSTGQAKRYIFCDTPPY